MKLRRSQKSIWAFVLTLALVLGEFACLPVERKKQVQQVIRMSLQYRQPEVRLNRMAKWRLRILLLQTRQLIRLH